MAKNLDAIVERMSKQIRDVVDRSYLETLARRARDIIYRRVKSGYGVNKEGGTEERLKPLSPSYIAQRRGDIAFFTDAQGRVRTYRPKKKPQLGVFGTPKKSNLTFSGETLESIVFKFSRYGVTLYFPNRKHKLNKRVTIREIARYVQENGRPFFYFSASERRILVRDLKNRVRSKLRLSKK